jgi:2-phospho-L-lactate guanylyltransferase (CobY/MobA/RfbA family)
MSKNPPRPNLASTIDAAFIIPVKPFAQAKSRLVDVFPAPSRAAMRERVAIALFDDTMDIISTFMRRHGQGRVKTIICSSDPAVARRTAILGTGFVFVAEPPANDGTIDHANKYAIRELGARGTILLMCDLPLLTVHAMVGLFRRCDRKKDFTRVILSPSMGNGCNMIARFPPDIMNTHYSSKHGPSFLEHLAIAKEKAVANGTRPDQLVEVYHSLDLYLDLDTPDDLMNLYPLLKEIKPASRLLQVLVDMDVRIEKNDRDDTRHVSIKVAPYDRDAP